MFIYFGLEAMGECYTQQTTGNIENSFHVNRSYPFLFLTPKQDVFWLVLPSALLNFLYMKN